MSNSKSTNGIIALVIVIVLAIVAYSILTMPDTRSPGEKVGDAISELDNGVDNAARELEDRTPAERIGDAVEDAKD